MKNWVFCVLGIALMVGACATRLPIVIDPAYPDSIFPEIGISAKATESAEEHLEAWTYFQAGDLEAANQRYARLLTRDPAFLPGMVGLGWVKLAEGDMKLAEDQFETALKDRPLYLSALVGYGRVMLITGRNEAAMDSFESALAIDSELSGLARTVEELRLSVVGQQLDAARQAVELGNISQARHIYERLLEMSPNSSFLQIDMGRVEFNLGNLPEALVHAREALSSEPDSAEALLLTGQIHEASGDLDAALSAYRRSDEISPDNQLIQKISELTEKLFLSTLPPEVNEIPSKETLSREDLAVLIGVRFSDVLNETASSPVIITDSRDSWGSEWIQLVADAGVMRLDAAYRFNPNRSVRRGELAEVIFEVLDRIEWMEIGSKTPDEIAAILFSDMDPTHLSYKQAQLSIAAGVLDVLETNSFGPSEVVNGKQAIDAVDRLVAVVSSLE